MIRPPNSAKGTLTRSHLTWIIVAALLTRGILLAVSPPTGGPLQLEPWVIAANLNAGHGFVYEQYGAQYRAWKEPLYIVLIAGLTRWLGHAQVIVVLFQSLFGVATALGTAVIAGRLLADPRAAAFAGLIVAVNPFLVYYDTQFIHPLSMDSFLFVVSTGAILLTISRGPTVRDAFISGLVMGGALWQRAALLACGLAMWTTAIVRSQDRQRRIKAALLWMVVALLVISPWVLRNYQLHGRLLLTTDFAHIVWLGNNPRSNGTYTDMKGQRVFDLADPAFQAMIRGAPELTQYDTFLRETWRFITEHPEGYARLVLTRLLAFFWFSPNAGVQYSSTQNLLYRAAYTLLLGLGVAGFLLYWRRAGSDGRQQALVLVAAVLGLACLHALTTINLKHRVPWELVLAVFGGEGLVRCGSIGHRPRRAKNSSNRRATNASISSVSPG